jgi:hypothetical protein
MTPTNLFAIAAADAQSCYAATDAGLWSWSAGEWTQIAKQFAPVTLTAVAALGNAVLIGAAGDIAVSRDGARSFGLATLPIKAHILALALSPNFAADRIALAATAHDGVLRSTDGGATFHAWNFGLIDLRVNALLVSPDFAQDATVFAATDHAVFMSTNSGRAWRELPLPADAAPCTALAFGPRGRLLVGTEGHGLWAADAPYAAFTRDERLKATEINALAATPHGPVAATTQGIFAHTGRTWKRIHDADDALSLTISGDTVLAGTAGGDVVATRQQA